MSAHDQSRPLGAPAVELYERFLRTGSMTAAGLVRGADLDASEVDRSLDQLVGLGLLDRSADGELSVPPPRNSVDSVGQRMEDSAPPW